MSTGRGISSAEKGPPPNAETFGQLTRAFERASRAIAGDVRRSHHLLAGRLVRVDVAGRSLGDGLRAPLAHLRVAVDGEDPSELTVEVWDEEETGIPWPIARPGSDDIDFRGELAVSADGRFIACRQGVGQIWLDRARGHLVGSYASASRLLLGDRGKPLQVPLAIWQIDRGVPVVHAGVVERGGKGVLFPGRGGSGKSTAALSCLQAGFGYVGDDLVGLEGVPGGHHLAHSLYSSANLDPTHLERFPCLKPHAIPGRLPGEDKCLILLASLYQERLTRVARLAAIAIPRIVDADDCRVRPAPRAEALRALAPSTLLFIPGQGAQSLQRLADVVSAVPVYRLELGRHLEGIAPCVDSLIRND